MLYNLTLNRDVLRNAGLDLAEAIALITIQFNLNLQDGLESIAKKGLIGDSYFEAHKNGNYFISEKGTKLMKEYIHSEGSVEKIKVSKARLENLANKMREIYPSGKKPGTIYYWRASTVDIVKKLDTFFKNYGDKYTDEEILQATTNYVNSFENDMKFMMLLQYFIWKEKGHYEGGTVSRNSELAARLDNLDDTSVNLREDWTSNIK